MKGVHHLSDQERFPSLTESGRKMLNRLREHEHAPNYNYACGDQLSIEGLERVRAYDRELNSSRKGWGKDEVPDWVLNFAERCLIDVPYYRRVGGSAADFLNLPTCSRKNLESEQWAFVPDTQSLDDMLIYYTSGTTGNSFYVLSHPDVSSMYLPALEFALSKVGIKIEGGPDRVFAINVCAQTSTLTYATVSSYFDGAGYAKINLNPNEWKTGEDVVKFIDDLQPEIFTGDPLAFIALTKLSLQTKPKALVSSAMTLMPALKLELEKHFACPVIDVYSMNESRFIAACYETKKYEIIPHDLFVEILDEAGNSCASGVRGEITLTCARNPFLPLLRYRTGDFATLNFDSHTPTLLDFEGRQPTTFINMEGKMINNIDVTHALQPFPIGQFSLHQYEDQSLIFKMRGGELNLAEIETALLKLFGDHQQLIIEALNEADTRNGKIIQYSSDINGSGLSNTEIAFQ